MGIKCPKCNTDNPYNQKFCGECATPLPSSKEIAVTETLETPKEELTTGSIFAGRYQIVEELGKGGMGKVYKAIDKKLNEEVALKLIKPDIASDKKTLERFNNELKFARKIAHKNVGRMYELMEEKGTHFITMEYVPGQDLRGLIRQTGQLTVGTAVSIAKQVCDGLTEAHRLGVIHRDLKPQNIMIDKEGNARIMDFGIARSVSGKGITGAGVMVGTPEYMSPEQVESKETDQRSDIYSLGVILYEMVTGRVPFEGDTPLSVAVKHKTETPPDPMQINTQIPEDLSLLILNCLEKDKEKRYQSAGEVRSELENIEKGIPTTEKVIPKRKPITSREITVQLSLKRIFIPALIIIGVVVIGIILLQILSRKESVPIDSSGRPSLAVMYFRNNTGDISLDHWSRALSDLLITDLSQSKYLRILSGDMLTQILTRIDALEVRDYSANVLKEVALRGGIENVLTGNFTKAGNNFRINVTLQNTRSGEFIASEMAEGVGVESFYPMVDELTKKIKMSFNLSEDAIANDHDMRISSITTSSPEAYRYYRDGRDLYLRGDFIQSIPLLEKAVEIDSEFAMAYRALSVAFRNDDDAKADEYLQKAFELSDRLSHFERMIIQGNVYAQIEKDDDKAIEVFKKVLEEYPGEIMASDWLGLIYYRREDWDNVIKYADMSRRSKNEFVYNFGRLSVAYASKGMYGKAREVVLDYIENYSDLAGMRNGLALIYACEGEYELALAEAEKALALNPRYSTRYRKVHIYQLMGRYEDAEKEYKKLLETENNIWHIEARSWLEILYRSNGQYKKAREQAKMGLELAEKLDNKTWVRTFLFHLAYNHWSAGNYDEALREAEKCWAKVVEDNVSKQDALFLKALIYHDLGQDEKAQAAAEEMKIILEGGRNPKSIKNFYLLQGIIEFKNKNYPKAIDYLNRAYALMPEQSGWHDIHALYVYYMGSAHLLSGDLNKAEDAFVKVTNMTTGRLSWGDLYTKSFYMLGKINEQQGNKAIAIEHYEKFLDLWKDADPGIAEVEDARKRLARLKSQIP